MLIENKQWIYEKRPTGRIGMEHYKLNVENLDSDNLKHGELLVKAKYVSVDPYMRIQQATHNTWEKPHQLGVVQGAGMVGEVITSRSNKFKAGDFVNCYTGWQEYAMVPEGEARLLDPEIAPISTGLGILGMPARVAYFGLIEAGKIKKEDTVVVSGAAGAVGATVVQIAKIKGCRVVGIVGSQEKMDYLLNELGVDAVINYKENRTLEEMTASLKKVVPNGIDIYYDNVGGVITDAVFNLINHKARILICGQISQYDHGLEIPEPGPRFLHKMLYTRATIQGILSRDYNDRMDEMVAEMGPWLKEGKLKYKETVVEGFDNLPIALSGLFEGVNTGKMLVKI